MAGHLLHLDNGAATGHVGNHSLPGSPTGGAAPPLPLSEPAVSVGEARKLSLQTEKKPGGFLTGFKKTLRSRKTETSLLYGQSEAEAAAPFASGAQVCVVTPYAAVCEDEADLQRGDLVQVLQYNRSRGYLVHRPQSRASPAAEGWVPPHVLAACGAGAAATAAGPRTAWAFRFRRPSGGSGGGSVYHSAGGPSSAGVVLNTGSVREVKRHSSDQSERRRVNVRLMESSRPPCRLRRAPSDVTVYAGETVVLTCSVTQPADVVAASWRDPWGRKMAGGRAWHTVDDDGTCRLTIQGAEGGDSGEYVCEVVTEAEVLRAAATVTVVADMT